nr:hypothetical protein [Mesorhizobium amorphae]
MTQARGITGKERSDFGDFLRVADAIEGRHACRNSAIAIRQELGVGETRRYGVHGDVAWPKFARQHPHELFHRTFAAEIEGSLAEEHPRASRRGDDDPSTVAQASCRFLQNEEDTSGVGVEDPVVVFFCRIDERLDDRHCCIRHDDVRLSECRLRLVEQASDVDHLRYIGLERDRLSTPGLDSLNDFTRAAFVLEIVDDHGGTAIGQLFSNRATDAARASSHDCGLPFERHRLLLHKVRTQDGGSRTS